MTRIIIGMKYDLQSEGIVKNKWYEGGYRPLLPEDNYSWKKRECETLMKIVGHEKWQVANLLYGYRDGHKTYVIPTLAITGIVGCRIQRTKDTSKRMLTRFVAGFYPDIHEDDIASLSEEIFWEAVPKLATVDGLADFVLLSEFAFPAVYWTSDHCYSCVERTLCDLRLHFLASGEEDLMNAAVLADMAWHGDTT